MGRGNAAIARQAGNFAKSRDTAELMLGQHSGPTVIAAGTVAYLQGKTASHGKD